jgi:hypothetical protein
LGYLFIIRRLIPENSMPIPKIAYCDNLDVFFRANHNVVPRGFVIETLGRLTVFKASPISPICGRVPEQEAIFRLYLRVEGYGRGPVGIWVP